MSEFDADHRLASAEPTHQPGTEDDQPHRLAGAEPAHQPTDAGPIAATLRREGGGT
jgi:hypothetical protein